MATYAEKLARSLEVMNTVQQDGIVRSERITRTHLERLTKAGFLQEGFAAGTLSPVLQELPD